MSQLLIDNVNKHIHLTKEDEVLLLSVMHPRKLRKKMYFVQEGDISQYTAFILKGCMRSFFIDAEGAEHNLQFAIEDWWITDISSFTNRKPGRLNIEALENVEMLIISRDEQQILFDTCPKFEKYFRIITENALVSYQNRLLDNMSLPAKERYINFRLKYPLLYQRLSQVHIAAYLGITPEFLSKLMHQMAKGE